MIKSYLTIAFRNLRKQRAYSLINLVGLAIGISCSILILSFIYDEFNFDRFHSKTDRIYRIVDSEVSPDQGEQHYGITSAPVGPAMQAEFPEVINSARFIRLGRHTVQNGDLKFYEEYFSGEQSLFEIFDFDFVFGDKEHALDEPNAVILSEETARKYFGDEMPIGKTLSSDRGHELKVTGVVNIPHNSHLKFDLMFSFLTLTSNPRFAPFMDRWDIQGFATYILLDEQNDAQGVQTKLPPLLKRNQPESSKIDRQLALQPLSDIHFKSEHIEADRNHAKGELAYVYILGAIAIFIVLIACINYMNLATARSFHRAAEVALRKVVGAQRRQLIGQFLTESVLLTVMALLLAFVIVQNTLPAFNAFTGKELSLDFGTSGLSLLSLVLLTFTVGMISGSYPAFYLSRLAIVRIIKGEFKTGSRKSFLRRGLVIVQFGLSIIMIIATLVVLNQMNFVQSKRLGFNQEHLLVVDINSGAARGNFQSIKNEFLRYPEIRSVSVTSRVPGEWKNLVEIEARPAGASEEDLRTMIFFGVDQDFLNTFEVELLHGRNFLESMTTDTTAVLVNETAADMLGGDLILNKGIVLQRSEESLALHVIGIVKDFHFRSLHEQIGPLVLGHSHNAIQSIDYFTARISGHDIPKTLDHLQQVHERFDSVTPFEYHFLDQQIENFYAADQRLGQLFGIAAGLAIFIACLGLFGLAAFTAEQRTKEIGVRKVLGASVPQIVFLLTKEFSRLVMIALVLAAPVGYIFARSWLQEFAYHSTIGPEIFLAAGLLALIIAWVTVGFQAIKAAISNPVDALRCE